MISYKAMTRVGQLSLFGFLDSAVVEFGNAEHELLILNKEKRDLHCLNAQGLLSNNELEERLVILDKKAKVYLSLLAKCKLEKSKENNVLEDE